MANTKKDPPKWFKQPLDEEAQLDAKKALVAYVIKKGIRDELPKACVKTTKSVLPFLQKFDHRWKSVGEDNFSTNYRAHQDLNQLYYRVLTSDQMQQLLQRYDEHMSIPEVDDDPYETESKESNPAPT